MHAKKPALASKPELKRGAAGARNAFAQAGLERCVRVVVD